MENLYYKENKEHMRRVVRIVGVVVIKTMNLHSSELAYAPESYIKNKYK